jgi:enoyl-CoA hydratase/carnithine racemase
MSEREVQLELADGHVHVRTEGHVGWMIFDRPERHNALSVEMWGAITEGLDVLEDTSAVRAIVLRGSGEKAFISGADISQFEQRRSSASAREHYDSVSGIANRRLAHCPLPTIAMIRGYCIGGGLGVALNCDLRYAAHNARFAIPAARLGVGYHHTGLKRLVDKVGPAFAKEIFFLARHFTADEAAAMGLVNRVVPGADLEELVADACERIARNAPLTLRSVKTIVAELVRGQGADLELCERTVDACFESADYVEGRRAFMEKRDPDFSGA